MVKNILKIYYKKINNKKMIFYQKLQIFQMQKLGNKSRIWIVKI